MMVSHLIQKSGIFKLKTDSFLIKIYNLRDLSISRGESKCVESYLVIQRGGLNKNATDSRRVIESV